MFYSHTHTHIPQYNKKIGDGGYCYDCGVELSADGQYGRKEYVKHATRGTYTLHSLYLLLWANFGTLCMALLTQPKAEAAIRGGVLSSWQSVRHYCVSQLRTVWMHMQNNLVLSDEERSFLVMCCTKRLYEVAMLSSLNYTTMMVIVAWPYIAPVCDLHDYIPIRCLFPSYSIPETLPQTASRASSRHLRNWTVMRRCGTNVSTNLLGVSSRQK